MSDLLTQKATYDDSGNMMVNQVTTIEGAILIGLDGGKGALSAMYDGNGSTYYMQTNPGLMTAIWDLRRKVKFNNIYLTAQATRTIGEDCCVITLWGSLNNTTWTSLGYFTSVYDPPQNICAAPGAYRYIRVTFANAGNTFECYIFDIKVVLA